MLLWCSQWVKSVANLTVKIYALDINGRTASYPMQPALTYLFGLLCLLDSTAEEWEETRETGVKGPRQEILQVNNKLWTLVYKPTRADTNSPLRPPHTAQTETNRQLPFSDHSVASCLTRWAENWHWTHAGLEVHATHFTFDQNET